MSQKLIQTYKEKIPAGILGNSRVEGHPLYWILIRLIQLGTFESLTAISAQTGLDEKTIEILFDIASNETLDFPLKITIHSKTKEKIIQIDPNALDTLRDSARKISPEHMPPNTILRKLEDGEIESVSTEMYLQLFRNSDHNLVGETVAILKSEAGLDDIRIIDLDNKPRFFAIQTPQAQFIFLPTTGFPENGYYADRPAVLDVREEAEEQVNAVYDLSRTHPIVLSTGFTERAQKACLHHPKVLLMSLWAFLKLIGHLQSIDKKSAGPRALMYIHKKLAEGGPGRFFNDSFVNKTIEEFLKIEYPNKGGDSQ